VIISVEIEGLGQLKGHMRLMGEEGPKLLRQVIHKTAELIKTRAQDEFVPIDQGTLAENIFVEDTKDGSDIYAGGPAAPYAVVQHEDLSLNHPPKDYKPGKASNSKYSSRVNPGGPKYIERPTMEEAPRIPANFLAEFDQVMG